LELGVIRYFTGVPCCRGHLSERHSQSGHCVACLSEKHKSPLYRLQNRERRRLYLSTLEGKQKNRENSRRARQRPEYREKQRENYKRYAKTDKGKAAAKRAIIKRRAVKFKALPRWVCVTEVNSFIDECPDGFHIDHIIPLAGEVVCGLHVLENLQYLPADENRRKSNKIDPLTLEANVCVLPDHREYVAPLGLSGF